VRTITRNFLIGLGVVLVVLVALGALPSYLQSGDPYYVSATPVEERGPAVNGSALAEQRFPYTTAALESGRSSPYWRGPIGLKESFTHTPFDEFAAFRQREPRAVNGSVAYVAYNGSRYRVAITGEAA
jgi:hypothetical protein